MKPPLRSLLPPLFFLALVPVNSVQPNLAERERIGMDLRLGVVYPATEELEKGLGYGVHFLFVMPGRFQGELGVDFLSSSQKPLTEVSVPGWRLREATSKVDLIPITLIGTHVLTPGRLNTYLGIGVGWFILSEHIEAIFVDTDYILKTYKSFSGGGPGGHMALGLRYIITPKVAIFSEIEYVRAWIDYANKKLKLRGPALAAGIRF